MQLQIEINLETNSIELLVDEETLKVRSQNLKPFTPKISSGWLLRYAALVTSANTGAVMKSPEELLKMLNINE